jgi:hypothetical protein
MIKVINSEIPGPPQALHDLIYVDNPVGFPLDKSCTFSCTGYSGVVPIGNFPASGLISRPYEDRSPIHRFYDYE